MRRNEKKKLLYIGLFIIAVIILLRSKMNGRGINEHMSKEFILKNLHEEVTNFSSTGLVDCGYRDTVYEESTMSPDATEGELTDGPRILEGGEHIPSDCKAKFSTAIIVPYRDQAEQLRGFLVYMHTFLRKQYIHYRIYVIEQIDTKPFNRAKLFNIGATVAMKAGFPCLILHDVDLLPLSLANLYACMECPRHMSLSINKFSFMVPYLRHFDGATAILSKQFRAINGLSNAYYGWSEDDDLYTRLEAHQMKLCRFDVETSVYHQVKDNQQKGEIRRANVDIAKKQMSKDGLNSLQYTEVATVLHPLFTHIIAELESPFQSLTFVKTKP